MTSVRGGAWGYVILPDVGSDTGSRERGHYLHYTNQLIDDPYALIIANLPLPLQTNRASVHVAAVG